MRRKLGLTQAQDDDAALVEAFLEHLEAKELDFTLSFRALSSRLAATDTSAFGDWEHRWRQRLAQEGFDPATHGAERRQEMDATNPLFIPRNHQVERAIQAAFQGDYTVFQELNEVLRQPFREQERFAAYALAPEPEERVMRTFCGT